MPELTMLGSALLLGLSGSGHCLGMCGGIASALALGPRKGPGINLAYHSGRITSYAVLGGALGLAAGITDIATWTISLRYLAGALLILMGLYVADWWRGMLVIEQAGARLWQPIQRLSSRWLPVRSTPQAFALGLTWGLMPCGLIYSALAWSATTQNAASSALLMLLFGLGTLPAMLATSLGAQQLQQFLRKGGFKLFIGILLILAGAWTLYLTASHSDHLTAPSSQGTSGGHEHHDGMHH